MSNKPSLSVFFNICFNTKEAIRSIIDYNSNYLICFLYILHSFPFLLTLSQALSLGDQHSLGEILLFSFLAALIVGSIAINSVAMLFHYVGNWIGGSSSFLATRAAVAWSSVPNLFNLLIWTLNYLLFGRDLFTSQFFDRSFSKELALIILLSSLFQIVMNFWSYLILIKAIAAVQKYSHWKAFASFLIVSAIIVAFFSFLTWFSHCSS